MTKKKMLKMEGVESIKKVSLRQNDVLLVEFPDNEIPLDEMMYLRSKIQEKFGLHQEILFYVGKLKFGVIEKEQIDIISGGDIHANLPDLK